MDDYVKPLVEEYERVEAEYKAAMETIVGLREKREKLRRAVSSLAPEAIGPSDRKPKPSDKKKYVVSAASVELVRAVVAEVNGAPFTPSGLARTYTQRLPSEATVAQALRVMHENGELRLVKTGRGGQKTYEVIR